VTDGTAEVMYKMLDRCKNFTIHIHYVLENPKFVYEETASRYGGNCECSEYVMADNDKG
jgi:hypothetical protein